MSKDKRLRARELGIEVGILRPGVFNAMTDVADVVVGHYTLIEGDDGRTGITAILPHSGNLFTKKVPCGIHVGNGHGKLVGYTQVEELGELETPILLTNTLNVFRVADGLIDYMLSLPGNDNVRSINPLVGETNDGRLNTIQKRPLGAEHVRQAIENATTGQVPEGCVGAGTGTICFGFKGGIGTASRVLPQSSGGYTVGVLVQTNFGGILQINGAPVGREMKQYYSPGNYEDNPDGSCMIVIATDAPLCSRNLKRLASRSILGLARTGGFCSNGSGDYAIAFSTAEEPKTKVTNDQITPLFLGVVEATEEAIYNSLFMATTTTGCGGNTIEAIDLDAVHRICQKYNMLKCPVSRPDN